VRRRGETGGRTDRESTSTGREPHLDCPPTDIRGGRAVDLRSSRELARLDRGRYFAALTIVLIVAVTPSESSTTTM